MNVNFYFEESNGNKWELPTPLCAQVAEEVFELKACTHVFLK